MRIGPRASVALVDDGLLATETDVSVQTETDGRAWRSDAM